MFKKNHKGFIVRLLFVLFITNSCDDNWDKHYSKESFNLPDLTLYGYIESDPDLKTFARMLVLTGYNEVINTTQSYTVWAPVNAALTGVDTSNMELIKQVVQNHIGRSRVTTPKSSISVQLLNGKFVDFVNQNSAYEYGGFNVLEPNINTQNGLVHKINGSVPYQYNLWEFLGNTTGLDSLKAYLYGQTIYTFDPINSTEIGVEDGQVIYDSVFIVSNPVLDEIGAINSEDSVYTVIMLDNEAWNSAYGRIEHYFNFPENGGSAVRQRQKTQY
ncbi:MAG: fasciclin domain-containing protein, partial [Salinivirgaceae bacterium]|nr:fasciclin domain-containing protein [Salinivirgaceae bacterium]